MESRYASESRGYTYSPSYADYSSESRSSESRCYYSGASYASVSHSSMEKQVSLESIDELISKLNTPITSNSTKIQKALSERDKKIEELRSLKEALLRKQEEDRELEAIKDTNRELDSLIKSLRNSLR